ncbi:glucose-1-phosphate thymidylyltransferase [Thermotoga sp. KOL6]|uniref:glucose-1-phosphate thymidylyltransferase n=1 Tax=Thermotoga sp. KOL6 TaxID=126741 RepID=UPI000C7730AF|nr:glucose-1-phosphate thymidylyltransferase [Thermotoga sp. KOL6]PLV58343.1 glucose-1-phosphate thymidylyltransferase [Thermotoga sp. KOL6]
MKKAIVLCAGRGTRLRPLTFTTAKHLIPIANKPILFYSLESIARAGIEEVGIVVNPFNKEEFRKIIGNGESFGLKITYIVQEEPKGLAHAVLVSKGFLGDDDFLMYLGDNLILEDLSKFLRDFEQSDYAASILLSPVKDPTRFGVAVMDGDRVLKVVEKPKVPPSNLAIVGLYLFRNKIFEGIENIKPSWRGELEITDAIEYLIEKGEKVKGYIIYGWWKDTGKPDDLLEANRKILMQINEEILGSVDEKSDIQGTVMIGKATRIVNSVIRGPVVVGENCFIKDTYIGPYTSVGNNVILEDCELENSIVMDDCSIIGIEKRVDSSILGKGVSVRSSKKRPTSLNLILGDMSRVEF